ncbi:MAG: hypothetical protein GF383_11885 [Candidatus Lokiarchaeota archaeon]|nr:hypothetical protein [Candidatus Lokiarchaeota archaeon]
MLLYNTNYTEITNNAETFGFNNLCGLFLNYSNFNTISGNKICNQTIGILLNNSNNNSIYNNIFFGNVKNIEENNCTGNSFIAPIISNGVNYGDNDDDGNGNGGSPPPPWWLYVTIGSLISVGFIGAIIVWKKKSFTKS